MKKTLIHSELLSKKAIEAVKHNNFRSWKSGKSWLFAGAMVTVALVGGGLKVSAATTAATSVAPAAIAPVTAVATPTPAVATQSATPSATASATPSTATLSSVAASNSSSSATLSSVVASTIISSSATTNQPIMSTNMVTTAVTAGLPKNYIQTVADAITVGTPYDVSNLLSVATDYLGNPITLADGSSNFEAVIYQVNQSYPSGTILTALSGENTSFTPTQEGIYSVDFRYFDPITDQTTHNVAPLIVNSDGINNDNASMQIDSNGTAYIGEKIDLSTALRENSEYTFDYYGNRIDLSNGVTATVKDLAGNIISTANNIFTPTTSGVYTVEYSHHFPVSVGNFTLALSREIIVGPFINAPKQVQNLVNQPYDTKNSVLIVDSAGYIVPFDQGVIITVTDPNNKPVAVTDFSFMPVIPGLYTVNYSYMDPETNKTIQGTTAVAVGNKYVTVTSPAVAVINDGKAYDLANGLVINDSNGAPVSFNNGNVIATVTSPNGKEVSVVKGQFVPAENGTYTVVYTYTDPISGAVVTSTTQVNISGVVTVTPTSNKIKKMTLPETGDGDMMAPYIGFAALALAGGFAYKTRRVVAMPKKK
ncbi:MAG: KxYKxGKxW signal peptide domain-containing protein [Streptococcaceae bacterium]|jgi:LPXTG-motif cell wall-anchored protein|nr:KxYKxGKxW signal peptide domain-containing protein [Streptococcaceae bacterium]